ncbi:Peptide-N4-(N-acetyl-beta-glucosaminyl)asparagine amidase A [Wickerhamiella sorbophila]|uniref:Peptide-N4-(N-acetyl-beta-glucosaminyl)asparagine amidase A n=1 Tax=Wickerhamiella sorbophila TaxID=45607 RepID=A0A2T0FCU8_9ASCO|nr:Peptide-N4-(N-acetyl-beta-glucosaminyl)asparagine amidase A [Wickerhamiella sorbophila]PRT52801.1 Peptide-N4-(N-acetyl-beta-glucosaminyl)asparagine amidase A [Wickerhamiella sorbophila]
MTRHGITWICGVLNYLLWWGSDTQLSSEPVLVTEYYIPTPNFGPVVASQVLFQEVIENSWGHDFVRSYNPPDVDFDHVKFYLQFDSFGRQYDRLAHIYLDDVEVWRPSTPEPGNLSAITSSFTKDMSFALPLLSSPRKLTVQLNNIMNDVYTGHFNTTLTAFYYKTGDSKVQIQESSWYAEEPPTEIKAVSPLLSFPTNEELVVNKLSQDTVRAVLQVHASGNAGEEFWYMKYSGDGGATRLVEVYVDGRLAGYADPFPQIYTGGFEPRLWTPIMGLRTFDVPAYYIDITPFLPRLWDSDTPIGIRVGNGYSQKQIGKDWLISVALLTWEEPGAQGTGGTHQTYRKDSPQIVQLPTTQIIQVSHTLRNSADLLLHGKSYYVESAQTVSHSSVLEDSRILAFDAEGRSTFVKTNSKELTSDSFSREHGYALALTLATDQITLAQTYEVGIDQAGGKYKVVAGHNGTWGGQNETGVCLGSYFDKHPTYAHSVRAVNREIVSETDQSCDNTPTLINNKGTGIYQAAEDGFKARMP